MIRPVAAQRILAVFAVTLAVAVGGCGAGDAPPASPSPGGAAATLAGTSWVVAAVAGRVPPVRGSEPTIAFDAIQARGSGGCNQFGGRYAYDPVSGQLRFDELGMTAMACAERARNDYEALFIQALGRIDRAVVAPDGGLTLTGPAGRIDLVLVGPAVTD